MSVKTVSNLTNNDYFKCVLNTETKDCFSSETEECFGVHF